jgi:hypothetical protein
MYALPIDRTVMESVICSRPNWKVEEGDSIEFKKSVLMNMFSWHNVETCLRLLEKARYDVLRKCPVKFKERRHGVIFLHVGPDGPPGHQELSLVRMLESYNRVLRKDRSGLDPLYAEGNYSLGELCFLFKCSRMQSKWAHDQRQRVYRGVELRGTEYQKNQLRRRDLDTGDSRDLSKLVIVFS